MYFPSRLSRCKKDKVTIFYLVPRYFCVKYIRYSNSNFYMYRNSSETKSSKCCLACMQYVSCMSQQKWNSKKSFSNLNLTAYFVKPSDLRNYCWIGLMNLGILLNANTCCLIQRISIRIEDIIPRISFILEVFQSLNFILDVKYQFCK